MIASVSRRLVWISTINQARPVIKNAKLIYKHKVNRRK